MKSFAVVFEAGIAVVPIQLSTTTPSPNSPVRRVPRAARTCPAPAPIPRSASRRAGHVLFFDRPRVFAAEV